MYKKKVPKEEMNKTYNEIGNIINELFQNPNRDEEIMAKILANRQYNQKEKNLF